MEEPLPVETLPTREPARQGLLWLYLLGGGVAWTLHLLLAYIIAEFGCISSLGGSTILGITPVAWMILVMSLVMLLAAGSVTWLAYRAARQLAEIAEEVVSEEIETELYMTRVGYIASALFFFIILIETVPIFFFLRTC